MLDEVLHDNPLFTLFLSSPHYAVAASQCLLVAVPPAACLAALSPRVSLTALDSHVLRASPYFVGQYLTANGRSVALSDGRCLQCVAGSGWSRDEEGRVSRIVASETYYDELFHSFTVLRVDMPLEGRVSADYERAVRSEGSGGGLLRLLPRRSLVEHEALLQRLGADGDSGGGAGGGSHGGGVLQSVLRFVQQFNSSYVLVRGFLDHAGQKVADACSRLSQEAVSRAARSAGKESGGAAGSVTSGSNGSSSSSSRRQLTAEVSAAVECAVLSGIHDKLFGGLVELHAADEHRLQANVRRLRSASMSSLGIRDDIRCQPHAACQLMAAVDAQCTPLQKMAQLEEVSRAITQAVREHSYTAPDTAAAVAQQTAPNNHEADHERSTSDSNSGNEDSAAELSTPRKRDLVLSAEDMIPLTLYVLTHSRLRHITAHMAHMRYFPPSPASECVDQLAVHWVNFQAACQLLQAGKLPSARQQLDKSEEEEEHEEGKEAVHPIYPSASSPVSSVYGVNDVSAFRATRRVAHHSRSVSSSVLSAVRSAGRSSSPSSSPTSTFSRVSSLPTAEAGAPAAARLPELLRPATVSTSADATATAPSNSDSAVRPVRLQRRHATLPTQRTRSTSPVSLHPPLAAQSHQPQLLSRIYPKLPHPQPHPHTHLSHQGSPAAAPSGSSSAVQSVWSRPPFRSPPLSASSAGAMSESSGAAEDDRLGHFLARLKRSEDVVTGNLITRHGSDSTAHS